MMRYHCVLIPVTSHKCLLLSLAARRKDFWVLKQWLYSYKAKLHIWWEQTTHTPKPVWTSRSLGEMRRIRADLLPPSLWRRGWWSRHSLVPRRCTPPHVRAPAAQPCILWRPLPTRGLSGRWSSWRSACRPGWVVPYGPTPCGLWRSSRSS